MKQISLFEFIDDPNTKPKIGTQILVNNSKGKLIPAIVKSHCGYDFFYVESEHDLLYGEKFLHTSMREKNKTWFSINVNERNENYL